MNDKKKEISGKHLTEKEKATILTLYEVNGLSQKEIGERLNRNSMIVGDYIRRCGAKKGSRSHEVQEKVEKALEQEFFDSAEVLARRVKETKEEHYKINSGLTKIVWGVLVKAQKEGRPVSSTLDEIRAFKTAAELFKITREERYASLGFKEEDDYQEKPMPELVVKELTAEEIQEQRRREAIAASDDLVLADMDFNEVPEDGVEIGDTNERVEVGFDEEEDEEE